MGTCVRIAVAVCVCASMAIRSTLWLKAIAGPATSNLFCWRSQAMARVCAFIGVAGVASAQTGKPLRDLNLTQKLASAGKHELHLAAAPFLTWGFKTRAFDGSIPGPTFRMDPGETLNIDFSNDLDPANNFGCDVTGTEFCESETSNLHTHGLHVSSKPGSDDIFTVVKPGTNHTYAFEIPPNHHPGTQWYHPHHHHATALQAGGGAAGLLIVNDPPGYLPDIYMNMPEKLMFVSYHDFGTLSKIAQQSKTPLMADSDDGDHPGAVYLVNGQLEPVMSVDAGIWYRLRMVFAAISNNFEMEIVDEGGKPQCEFQLMAKDGIYLDTIPRGIKHIPLFPGARADVAMKCSCTSYPCTASTGKEGSNMNIMTISIAQGAGSDQGVLPTFKPVKPCYLADLTNANIPEANVVSMELKGSGRRVLWNGNGAGMTYEAVHAVGSVEEWPAIGTVQIGQAYEVEADGILKHPLHMHISPYQVIEMPSSDYVDGYFLPGDWQDTLQLPIQKGQTARIRMQFDRFTGKQVVHCHKLQHEDEGMMAYLDITGTEGASYECAKSLDTMCYDGFFADRPTEPHPVNPNCIADNTAINGAFLTRTGFGLLFAMFIACLQ